MTNVELNSVRSFFDAYRKWYLSHKDLSLYLDVPGTITSAEMNTKLEYMEQQFAKIRVTSRRRGIDSMERGPRNASFMSAEAARDGRGYATEILSRFKGGYHSFDTTAALDVDGLLSGRVCNAECFLVDDEEALDMAPLDVENASAASSRPSGANSQHNVTPLPIVSGVLASALASRPLTIAATASTKESLPFGAVQSTARLVKGLPTAAESIVKNVAPLTPLSTQRDGGGVSFRNSPVAFGDSSWFGLLRTSTPLADKTNVPDFTTRFSDIGVTETGRLSTSFARTCDKTADPFRTAFDGSVASGRGSDAFVTANASNFSTPKSAGVRRAPAILTDPTSSAAAEDSTVKDIEDVPSDVDEIFAAGFLGGCSLAKWIQHFSRLHDEITVRITEFEKDASQKKLRFALKRSIVDRINFSAKKKASNADVALALNFFLALAEGRPVVDSDGGELTLDPANRPAVDYAMYTIAQKYLEQVKWDLDLMDTIVLVLISICRNFADFHDIMCAVVLNASVLLKMSVSKVLDKALSFAHQPPEAAVLWISAERAVFRLFTRVQISLKSQAAAVAESAVGEASTRRGLDLLHMFLADTLGLRTPVFCSSSFVVAELIEHFHKHLARWELKHSAVQPVQLLAHWRTAADRIWEYDWAPRLAVIDRRLAGTPSVATIVRSRHDALLCVLRHAVESRLKPPTVVTQKSPKRT